MEKEQWGPATNAPDAPHIPPYSRSHSSFSVPVFTCPAILISQSTQESCCQENKAGVLSFSLRQAWQLYGELVMKIQLRACQRKSSSTGKPEALGGFHPEAGDWKGNSSLFQPGFYFFSFGHCNIVLTKYTICSCFKKHNIDCRLDRKQATVSHVKIWRLLIHLVLGHSLKWAVNCKFTIHKSKREIKMN